MNEVKTKGNKMKDIIIGGVSLEVLKQQQVAIRKDASKVIAEHLEKGKALVAHILEEPDEEHVAANYEEVAKQACEHLEIVQLVAGISGVTFFLPFYEEYGRYDSDEIMSQSLEGSEHLEDYWGGAVSKLYSILEDMEGDSCNWHSSRC